MAYRYCNPKSDYEKLAEEMNSFTEERIAGKSKIEQEQIYFMTDDFVNMGFELFIYPTGTAYVNVLNKLSKKERNKFVSIKKDEVNNLAEKTLEAIGDLNMQSENYLGVSETIMEVNNYKGQSKSIGFNNEAPTEKLNALEKELIEMCLKIVKGRKWEEV